MIPLNRAQLARICAFWLRAGFKRPSSRAKEQFGPAEGGLRLRPGQAAVHPNLEPKTARARRPRHERQREIPRLVPHTRDSLGLTILIRAARAASDEKGPLQKLKQERGCVAFATQASGAKAPNQLGDQYGGVKTPPFHPNSAPKATRWRPLHRSRCVYLGQSASAQALKHGVVA